MKGYKNEQSTAHNTMCLVSKNFLLDKPWDNTVLHMYLLFNGIIKQKSLRKRKWKLYGLYGNW